MTVQQIAARVPLPPLEAAATPSGPHATAFSDLLERAHGPPEVAVSAAAAERMAARGIALPDALRARIGDALDALAATGARDAVLLSPDAAFLAHVPDRTVVTAFTADEMRAGPLTDIDSALLL